MPLSPDSTTSTVTGRATMTRSEAARHAANVRYGKEAPFAARLAAIRDARKQRKARGGKGKKPGQTSAQRDQQKRQAQTANVNAVGDKLDAADMIAGADAYDNGGDVDPAIQKDMVAAGLGELGKDGSFRLSSTGREVLSAARRGDIGAVRDALSRGKDSVAVAGERAAAGAARAAAATEKQSAREKATAEKEQARAEKEKAQAKEKAKSGGGGKEKAEQSAPVDKAAERAMQRDGNRADVQQRLESGAGQSLNRAAFDTLTAFADGGTPDEEVLSAMADHSGLVERDSAGGYRMTPEGRAYVSAADKGNARAAGDALSRAVDTVTARSATGPTEQDANAAADAAVTQDRLKYRKKRQTWKALVREWRAVKHMPGGHDQRSHGRATARRSASNAAYASVRMGGGTIAEARQAKHDVSTVYAHKQRLANIDQQLSGAVSEKQRSSLDAEKARLHADIADRAQRTTAAGSVPVHAPTVRGREDPGGIFGKDYEARQRVLQDRFQRQQSAREAQQTSRAQFFEQQTAAQTTTAPTWPIIKPGSAKPVTAQAVQNALPERYQALSTAAERVKMPQAGWNQPISGAQTGYLKSLVDKARTNTAAESQARRVADELLERMPKLTKWEASQYIDAMKQPKPFGTLMAKARAAIDGGGADDPGRALFALPNFRTALINSILREQADAEELPF